MVYAKIQPATSYRVTYTPSAKRGGKSRSRVVLTQRAAFKAVAWWMIIDGHGSLDAIETVGKRYSCECHRDKNGLITSDSFFDDGVGAFVPGWHCCEIHNRNDGYLKRLHQRLIRFAECSQCNKGSEQ